MTVRLRAFGAKLGVGISVLGFVLVFLGWNGAASHDRVPSQIPYLVSGGVGGLALVVLGAAIIVAQAARADRAALQATIRDLQEAVERSNGGVQLPLGQSDAATAPATVVAGKRSYHRPSCRLVAGREARLVPVSTAEDLGLEACRICTPGGTGSIGGERDGDRTSP